MKKIPQTPEVEKLLRWHDDEENLYDEDDENLYDEDDENLYDYAGAVYWKNLFKITQNLSCFDAMWEIVVEKQLRELAENSKLLGGPEQAEIGSNYADYLVHEFFTKLSELQQIVALRSLTSFKKLKKMYFSKYNEMKNYSYIARVKSPFYQDYFVDKGQLFLRTPSSNIPVPLYH